MKALLATLAFFVQGSLPSESLRVSVETLDGEEFCSVRARQAVVDDLLSELAARSGRKLVGALALGRAEPVDIDLENRPFVHVANVIAGCGGLVARVDATSIMVERDLQLDASTAACDDRAELGYLRAIKAFPDDPRASSANFALGAIQDRRGNPGAARIYYAEIARRQPESQEAPEAMLRAGLALESEKNYADAARMFSALANLPRKHPWQAQARLELARTIAHQGDGDQALSLLGALDRLFPAVTIDDRVARAYVRAQAYSAAGQHDKSLQALDEASSSAIESAYAENTLRIRADALAHMGRPAEAARAWLACAQATTGREHDAALLTAAQQSLEAGDVVGVLFLERMAKGTTAEVDVASIAASARESLGLGAMDLELSLNERLARGIELVSQHERRRGLAVLEPLYAQRERLSQSELVAFAVAYATAIDAERGLEPAIDILRTSLRLLTSVEDRKRLYVLAAELYEARELYEQAADAYGGRFR